MAARLPDWPLTRAPLLDEFKQAMQARSKAIRYRVRDWRCERLTEDDGDGGQVESMTVNFDGVAGSLLVRLWSDGFLFVNRRTMVGPRVTFQVSFDASLAGRTCDELVTALEDSLGEPERERLLNTWAAFRPGAVQTRP